MVPVDMMGPLDVVMLAGTDRQMPGGRRISARSWAEMLTEGRLVVTGVEQLKGAAEEPAMGGVCM